MNVYTARIGQGGENELNITIKSGDKTFAPTWNMVMSLKKGDITNQEYREQYLSLMRISYRENRARWKEVLDRETVVLTCYCQPGAFCHRVLLARIFQKLGAKYHGETR